MAHSMDSSSRPQSGPLPEQWPVQATETIVRVVGQVRDRTTKPAITAARALVYGLFAGILGVVAFALAIALLIRLGDNYLPGRVWIVYVALGAVFTVAGLALWGKAFATPPDKS